MSWLLDTDVLSQNLESRGFVLLRNVFTAQECEQAKSALEAAFAACEEGPLRRGSAIYGARNVAELWPAAEQLWRKPALLDFLQAALGHEFGLVRILFFDKPPDASWSLPWHKDLTIAVADNRLPSSRFQQPTTKAGVPHIEAPPEILEQMLTLRLHLDPATDANGPLQVIPGSHRDLRQSPSTEPPVTILASAGDILAMRPLLSHCSGLSAPGAHQHRRILHFEFAASVHLPDGFHWHRFIPGHEME